ncbi:MAG: hypothetical protein M3041_10050, partial [Acidobacteriota bacterium]|nr:hypothetical protein [Acidobacteriota bacterium]
MIVGGDVVTVNVGPVPVPTDVVTVTGPVVAPAGTFAPICVSLYTVKVVAATPLNLTELVPMKFAPL